MGVVEYRCGCCLQVEVDEVIVQWCGQKFLESLFLCFDIVYQSQLWYVKSVVDIGDVWFFDIVVCSFLGNYCGVVYYCECDDEWVGGVLFVILLDYVWV